jgi:hypothetical protein
MPVQSSRPSRSVSSRVNQDVGTSDSAIQLDTNTVFPTPAGATTRVSGAAIASSRSRSNRVRRTWCFGTSGGLSLARSNGDVGRSGRVPDLRPPWVIFASSRAP